MAAEGAGRRTRVGRYELGRTIGEGSFTRVKLARDSRTGDAFAIKVLDRNHVLRHRMVEQGSSDEFIDANILVLAVARKLKKLKGTRTCMVFPDQPEKRRASQLFQTAIDSIESVTISSLDDVPTGPVNNFFKSIRNTLDFDFADDNEDPWKSYEPPSLYVFINSSTRDLSSIEKYVKLADLSTVPAARLIDGILLTKFETINKVGAALSMVYISGAPVMFAGCGQSYTDLKKLNVRWQCSIVLHREYVFTTGSVL